MRAQKPKDFWEKHIEAYQKSNMTQRAYCEMHKLREKSLQYHLRRKRKKQLANSATIEKSSEWLPITIVNEPENVCNGGIRLHISKIMVEAERGFDGNHLANLLRAVGAAC